MPDAPETHVAPRGDPVDVTIADRTAPHVGAVVKVDSRVIAGPKVDPPNGVHHVPMSLICPTKSKPANSTKLFDATCSASTRTTPRQSPATW